MSVNNKNKSKKKYLPDYKRKKSYVHPLDIRPAKKALRHKYKALRNELATRIPAVKKEYDELIFDKIIALDEYISSANILVYVSTEIEVDTIKIIEHSFENGKNVYVPRCVVDTRDIEFFKISSIDELALGTFGVLEPARDDEKIYKNDLDASAFVLVPALCYDYEGFRLGYGKGYYDRFLSKFRGHMVGLCYNNCIEEKLPHGRYDRSVEKIVTEQDVLTI